MTIKNSILGYLSLIIFFVFITSCESPIIINVDDAQLAYNFSSHNFGTVNYGDSQTINLNIQNQTLSDTKDCTAPIITGSGKDFYTIINDSCGNNPIKSKSSCSVEIEFSPLKVGLAEAVLEHNCDGGIEQIRTEINLSANVNHLADSSNSSIIAVSTADADDGNSAIQITLKDASNNPVWGVVPEFGVDNFTHAFIINNCSESNSSGVSNCTAQTPRPGSYNLQLTSPISVVGGALNINCAAGGISSNVLDGAGTVGSPYEITSIRELEHMRCHSAGDYFLLMNDLDLSAVSWESMKEFGGTQYNAFFDGGNNIIENFSLTTSTGNRGFFDTILGGYSVSNLTFHNPQVVATAIPGSILASLSESDIINVHVTSDFSNPILISNIATGAPSGGLLGAITNGPKLTNVSVVGNINFVGSAVANFAFAAIVGRMAYSVLATNVSYTGTMTQIGTGTAKRVGGITGSMQSSTINGCNVNADFIFPGNANILGGATGYQASSSTRFCDVTGNIIVSGTGVQVGGVSGHKNAGSMFNNTYSGDITIGSTGSSIGGITGTTARGSTSYNSNSAGNINAPNCSSVGGISGNWSRAGATLMDSFSTMNLNGLNNVGGLIGTSSHENATTIQDSYYSGNINSGGINVGGIIANINATTGNVIIQRVFSSGNFVTSGSVIGGIAGLVQTSATIEDVFSTAYLEANDTLGGIIGSLDPSSSVDYALFFGTHSLNTVSSLVGGIVGSDSGSIGANVFWDDSLAGIGQRDDSGSASGLLNTAQSQNAANYSAGFQAEFISGTVWNTPSAGFYPTLIP